MELNRSILNHTPFRLKFEHLTNRAKKRVFRHRMIYGTQEYLTESMGGKCSVLNQTSVRLVLKFLHVGTNKNKKQKTEDLTRECFMEFGTESIE